MKIYILKRRGRNWIGNLSLSLKVISVKDEIFAGVYFVRKKDAEEYKKQYDGKYGNPFEVWSAELTEDKRDNRKK